MYNNQFDLSLISKYRTQLMGVAAIMVICCHANVYGVQYPSIVSKILNYGNLGVEIFLFLSGVGLYYSLNGGGNLTSWYKRRFKRIAIPYIVIQIPFWIFWIAVGHFDLLDNLYILSTLKYWTHHQGAWYVALLVPLYLVSPFLYKLFQIQNLRLPVLIGVTIVLTALSTTYQGGSISNDDIGANIVGALKQCIPFFVGMYIAPYINQRRAYSFSYLIVVPVVVYALLHYVFPDVYMRWLLVFPIVSLFCTILTHSIFERVAFFFGYISLESYLANIYSCSVFSYISSNSDCCIFRAHYADYLIVILMGTLIAYLTNKISNYLMH